MKYRLGLVLLAVAALFAALCWLLALWRPYVGAAVFIVVFGCVLLFYLLTLRRVRGQWFDSGGIRIHYTDEGDGEPVILIHGLAVNADINWRVPGVIRMLRKTHRVIAIDLRGHGLSEHPHDPGRYGVELVEDAVRLMDHLGIERAHVVGYSLGGFTTLKLVALHPERLRTAVVGGAGWYDETTPKMSILRALEASLEQGGGFTPLIRALEPTPNPSRLKVWLIDAAIAWICDLWALRALVSTMLDLRVTEDALRANRVPTLVIVGDRDPLVDAARNLDGVMSATRVVYVPGGDHATTMFSTVFRREIQRQLREQ